ncbi:MAG TPA: sulfatase-like hydrolase/transferase [Steroidobacteraceae bacterium]|nr:sulfatase-like hydrolase/transferase [Steroidobacteraceae bacterium]
MTLNSRRILAIIAISAWPAINYLEKNWAEVARRGPRSVLWILVFTAVFIAIGLVFYRLAQKRRPGGGAMVVGVCLATILLVFSYSTLDTLRAAFFAESAPWFTTPMAWVLLIGIVAAMMYRYRKLTVLHTAAVTFCLLVAGFAGAQLVLKIARYQAPPVETAEGGLPSKVTPRKAGMNVYYILIDAYAGRAGLKQVTGYDNTPFYTELGKRGFVDVSTEHSNYLRTILSLGGIFALQYPQTDDPRTFGSTEFTYPEIFDKATPPALIRRLHAAGYEGWHSATPWGGCAHRYLKCLGDEFLLETDYVTRTFLAPTPLGRPIEYLSATTDDAFLSVETRLPLVEKEGKPLFVFVHLMDAHPPFRYDNHCGRKWVRQEDWNGWHKGLEHEYVDAVKCVNNRVEHLIDVLLARNPESIIVLQGDHGSAFTMEWEKPMATWKTSSIAERGSYLNLVRAPEDCRQWLKPMGQINTARFVIACVEGREPELLPERTYLTTYSEGAEKDVLKPAPAW